MVNFHLLDLVRQIQYLLHVEKGPQFNLQILLVSTLPAPTILNFRFGFYKEPLLEFLASASNPQTVANPDEQHRQR